MSIHLECNPAIQGPQSQYFADECLAYDRMVQAMRWISKCSRKIKIELCDCWDSYARMIISLGILASFFPVRPTMLAR